MKIDFVTVHIGGQKQEQRKPSMLLDGSSDFVLTYEDKDGDWMLVGDVPFRYICLHFHYCLIS